MMCYCYLPLLDKCRLDLYPLDSNWQNYDSSYMFDCLLISPGSGGDTYAVQIHLNRIYSSSIAKCLLGYSFI